MANVELQLERHKAALEYSKFLTTLSTGSLVLLTSFLEKIANQPKWGFLAIVSFVAFMMSALSSVVLYTLTMAHVGDVIAKRSAALVGISLVASWLFFLLAICSLALFAVRNLAG